MAVINLKVAVGDLTSALEQFDKIKVYRSVTGESGVYAEITTPLTRMTLELGKTIYTFTDLAGDASYYYRSSYFNSLSSLESSQSDPQQGEGAAALGIVTVEQLKERYLFGIDLTDDEGTPYPDSLYEHYIESAVSKIEHKLDMPLVPKVFDEKHDYYKEDYHQYIWMELDKYPVLDIEKVQLILPGNQAVQTFPSDWFQLMPETGQLQLIPGLNSAGTIALGAFSGYLPNVYGARRFIPNAFEIRYTAGFEAGKVPKIVEDLVGKLASFGPLNIAGDLLGGAGIASQSVSLDGLSTNFNTTSSATSSGYGSRLIQYSKELKEDYKMLLSFYKRHSLAVG